MYVRVRLLLIFLFFVLNIAGNANAASPCANYTEDFDINSCVIDIATWACRKAKSRSDLLSCFTTEARKLISSTSYKGAFNPDCAFMTSGPDQFTTASCDMDPGWGAGDEYSYRSNEVTVQHCVGFKCEPDHCNLGDIKCSSIAIRVPFKD